MDGLVFGSSQKPTASTLDERGHGSRPAERQKKILNNGAKTSLFGNDQDSGVKVTTKSHARNSSNINFNEMFDQDGASKRPSKGRSSSMAQNNLTAFKLNYEDEEGTENQTPVRATRKAAAPQAQAQWSMAIDSKQPEANPDDRVKITTAKKRQHVRSSSSMGMTRLLANPQESMPAQTKGQSKFIANSGTKMQRLAELDRKTKHAHLKSQSNIFASAMPASASTKHDEVGLKRKGGTGSVTRGSMGGIMSHDEGPYAKMEWPSKKLQVTGKPSEANEKQVKRQTFIKVMSAKKEQVRTRANEGSSQVF